MGWQGWFAIIVAFAFVMLLMYPTQIYYYLIDQSTAFTAARPVFSFMDDANNMLGITNFMCGQYNYSCIVNTPRVLYEEGGQFSKYLLMDRRITVPNKTYNLTSYITIKNFSINLSNSDIAICLNGYSNGYWLQDCITRNKMANYNDSYYIDEQIWNDNQMVNNHVKIIPNTEGTAQHFELHIHIINGTGAIFSVTNLKDGQTENFLYSNSYLGLMQNGTEDTPTSLWTEVHYNSRSGIPNSINYQTTNYPTSKYTSIQVLLNARSIICEYSTNSSVIDTDEAYCKSVGSIQGDEFATK
ncbi:hypothetical protein Mia14_0472 [Candidatus Mancarchaeum acidiphilum]|uniref:Uncharacterized protein n=1 Tax=Candidatus Mancarchaeum acidiphilum TaxID=1920749 RepID=A0A218NMS9_9ARCH|nr:hypothetical protein [Candidatus Mancarchaeum acidiphilum]ASI13788.1 hypothetical protein Mia14_0472 [Candidatus Mancarchaeum acidiphilum]